MAYGYKDGITGQSSRVPARQADRTAESPVFIRNFQSVTGLSILRRLLYCLRLGITSGKKLFTPQHGAFQIGAITQDCFHLLGASRRHVMTSRAAVRLTPKHFAREITEPKRAEEGLQRHEASWRKA
jgi:hypothetical protein